MKKIINVIALLLLSSSLIVSNALPLNGMNTIEIAHKLPILLLPADIMLYLYPVLLLLLGFWICTIPSKDHTTLQTVLFSTACVSNAAWFPLWHASYFGWALFSSCIALSSLYVLYRSYPTEQHSWRNRVPISVFLALSIVVVVLNLNYLLVFFDWNRFGISHVLWTIINLTGLTAAALHFSFHYRDRAIIAVFLLTFLGIVVNVSTEELFVSLSTLFLMAIMTIGSWIFSYSNTKKQQQNTSF